VTELTGGSLFTGAGGLDMAVARALADFDLSVRFAWHSDIKPASVALLRHRHPDVPNLGNMARAFPVIGPVTAEAAGLEPIDVLAASWPCQPHSSAGKRLGEADPRALWPNVARAIAETRPRIFFGENVARITSNGELRRVVRGLAALGYVGSWRVQRASDPGVWGCHQRARCFVVAIDAAADAGLLRRRALIDDVRPGQPHPAGRGHLTLLPTPTHQDSRAGVRAQPVVPMSLREAVTLLPTPTQSMTTGAGTSGRDGGLNLQTAVTLLPTPIRTDGQGGVRAVPERRTHGGNDHGPRLRDVAVTLIPTPREADAGGDRGWLTGEGLRDWSREIAVAAAPPADWGVYAEAVARWGCMFDREAPAPTQLGPRGGFQLAPPFVEWMMGLPQGWVCDVPDLAARANGHRNAALSLLGDGVVPQQGAAAFRYLLGHLAQRLAVAA
jgi:DNA (cytosine-5)-methyltransferase 1